MLGLWTKQVEMFLLFTFYSGLPRITWHITFTLSGSFSPLGPLPFSFLLSAPSYFPFHSHFFMFVLGSSYYAVLFDTEKWSETSLLTDWQNSSSFFIGGYLILWLSFSLTLALKEITMQYGIKDLSMSGSEGHTNPRPSCPLPCPRTIVPITSPPLAFTHVAWLPPRSSFRNSLHYHESEA